MTERSWFDDVAEIYDRVRPRYPTRLFDDLLTYLGRDPDRQAPLAVVEIGPGTGQATAPVLARGMTVTAVEPGPRLAAYLRRKLADEPRLTVINDRFEDAPLPGAAADLVLAASSFHWIDPAVRYRKSLAILRPGGVLAVIGAIEIASEVDRGFFDASQVVYRRHFPDAEPELLPDEDAIPPEHPELIESGQFRMVELHRYRWDQRYDTAGYIDLVRTYSDTNRMVAPAREAFLTDLTTFIDTEFDGSVVRPLVITLTLARKP
jgi:SAM-dependent methyltransferase